MGEDPPLCAGKECAEPRQLCRSRHCSCKVRLLNGKTKFVSKKDNKKGKKETAEGSMFASARRATSRAAKSTRVYNLL